MVTVMRKILFLILLTVFPAEAAPRLLVTLGDSIVAGGPIINGAPSWTELLQTRRIGERFAANNAGVGGYTAAQTLTLLDATYIGKGYTDAVVLVCTNNLANGDSAASCLVTLNTIIAHLTANGITVAVCTVPPRGGSAQWDGTKETQRLALNTSILALTTATPINLETALGGVGSPLALAVGADSGDHLHPNAIGHVAIADAIDAAVSW